ncbi:MAG: TIM barrel protein [Oscillospiraceae bacterium]|nr:TIM barrel protein [Oscillospiraceae bacterium]MBQ9938788.1 TIM barrel protein [Oscillospiraceae bacterium]
MSYSLGLVSVSFREHSPAEILAAMKAAGLTHIEWGSDIHAPADDVQKLNEIVRLQQEFGIVCCAYGTYFRLGVTPIDELTRYISAAKMLGTSILRLWCGNKNSQDYSPEEKADLFEQCRRAAKIAEQFDVTLCMECHNNTCTNTKESSLELMQAVDSQNFKMYWQPNQHRSNEENLRAAALLAPFTEHLHVFNWKGNAQGGTDMFPLADGAHIWREYLGCFDKDKTLLLEFMPDGKIETLPREAAALFDITGAER